jgi:hypothetical protein
MTQISNSIDARGPRFGALITTLVLAVVLLTESIWLLGLQALVFATGAFFGPVKSPYAFIYKKFIQKRLKSELVKEDAKPPQFAQFVGLLFALTALAGLFFELNILFLAATAMALVAAFLNAFFDFCLGCQMYLIIKRLTTR